MVDVFYTGLFFIFIYLIYYLFIPLTMLFISSYVAAITMLLFPIIFLLSIPEKGIEFLAYAQVKFFNEVVTINNLHILLFIWASLFGIIMYTEILSRYISQALVEQDYLNDKKTSVNYPGKSGLINATFKPVEQLKYVKHKRILKSISMNENDATELIEMVNRCRKNFNVMVKEKENNERT